MLEIEAIEPVPSGQERTGVYSILFLVSKSSGGLRGILNLKSLNKFVLYRRFKMQSLNTILECIRDADVMTSVDLQEVYLHVPIHPAYQKFLRFAYANRHYQYKAMPFSLSSAPRTFTKLLAAVAAAIRLVPVRILCYLDDVLILSPSHQQAKRDLDTVCHTLSRHGFSINLKKSDLQPTTCITHLGAIIDFVKGQVFLSVDRQRSIGDLVASTLAQRRVALLSLSQLLGKFISCISIVPWARRHARPLQ